MSFDANYIKSIFSTLDGRSPSYVRWLLFFGVSPFVFMMWEEVFYFMFHGEFTKVDGGIVGMGATIGSILSANFGFARWQEGKEAQSSPPQ